MSTSIMFAKAQAKFAHSYAPNCLTVRTHCSAMALTKTSLHHLIVAELLAMLAKFCGSLSVILAKVCSEMTSKTGQCSSIVLAKAQAPLARSCPLSLTRSRRCPMASRSSKWANLVVAKAQAVLVKS